MCVAAVLHNFAVFPAHKEGGAGAMLLSWPFGRADEEGVVCYADVEEGGETMALAEKVGFVRVDRFEIDLTLGGLEGLYTHVALVKEPMIEGRAEGMIEGRAEGMIEGGRKENEGSESWD